MKSIKKDIGFSYRRLIRLDDYPLGKPEGLGKYIELVISQKRIIPKVISKYPKKD